MNATGNNVFFLDFGENKERTLRKAFEDLSRMIEADRKNLLEQKYAAAYAARREKPTGPEAA